jgi:hypothetical protein
MPALLDEIIEAATDGEQPLTDVLRKCLRLGHALKSERLKSWASQELNGYSDGETVDSVRELIRVDDYSRKILMDFVRTGKATRWRSGLRRPGQPSLARCPMMWPRMSWRSGMGITRSGQARATPRTARHTGGSRFRSSSSRPAYLAIRINSGIPLLKGCLSLECRLERLQILLGHRKVAITEKHYSRWKRQAVVDAAVRGSWKD